MMTCTNQYCHSNRVLRTADNLYNCMQCDGWMDESGAAINLRPSLVPKPKKKRWVKPAVVEEEEV